MCLWPRRVYVGMVRICGSVMRVHDASASMKICLRVVCFYVFDFVFGSVCGILHILCETVCTFGVFACVSPSVSFLNYKHKYNI